jgi:CheY-like chemotaxis protein
MAAPNRAPLVAIVNTSEDVANLLQTILEDDGYRTVVVYVPDLRRDDPDPLEFLQQHDPAAVVWDIAIPYEQNWSFFQTVQRRGGFQGRGVVLTTTNLRALEGLVGPTGAHEMIGKPFDLDQILAAVRRATQLHERS